MIEIVVSPLAMKVRRAATGAAADDALAATLPQSLHIPKQVERSWSLGLLESPHARTTAPQLRMPGEPVDPAYTAAFEST